MTRHLVTLALLALLVSPVCAQTAGPRLRSAVTVSADLVRLGDLVEDAGDASALPVFRAPDIGTTGTVHVSRVLAAAHEKGLGTIDTRGLSAVTVTRASRTLSLGEMEAAVRDALPRDKVDADAEIIVTLDRGLRDAHIEADNAAPLQVARLDWVPATGRFDALLVVEGSSILAATPIRLSGSAVVAIEVPVFTRAMAKGEIVRAADIAMERLPRAAAARVAVPGLAAAVGQAVRRSVQAGQPVVASDLAKPNLVNRNDGVTLTCETPGMVLTIRAKALEAGAQGDTVAVLNAQSNRVVQATVIGPGRVSVLVGTAAVN